MPAFIPYPRDPSQEVRVPVEALRQFVVRLLVRKSMFQFDADAAAARLIEADLRGLQSHGVRALPRYIDAMDAGDIDPRARLLVEHETPAMAVLCGSTALGHVAATKGMQLAIAKAKECGVGAVTVHHSQHLGAASVYALLAAREGLIGFCTSNTGSPTVAAPGAVSAATANNPLAWAAPAGGGPPLVFDMACGEASWGKVHSLGLYGLPLPDGVALDAEGHPTTDPKAAKTILPAAGVRGFGLAMLASILSGALAGGKLPHKKTRSPSAEGSEHFLLALDVGQFTDAGKFGGKLADQREFVRGLPPAAGVAKVRAPGDLANAEEQERRDLGIPLHRADVEELQRRATKLKVEHPF
jgi:LDH2 family malate/lactate/ureidoglycolate dehydrogenase